MNLAEHQRKLFSMIKDNYIPQPEDEAYFQALVNSNYLERVREIVTWWRIFDLERYCVLTVRLLKQLGEYESRVDRFVKTHTLSPFVNELCEAFLQDLGSNSDDHLLSEVALFELALARVKHGDLSTYTIEWEHNPADVLTCLVKDIPIEVGVAPGRYRVTVKGGKPSISIDPI
jgi:hypothetical protein